LIRRCAEAAFRPPERILMYMPLDTIPQRRPMVRNLISASVFLCALASSGRILSAQETAPGEMAPPPEHHVTRIGNEPEAAAPPSLPPAEIIQRFSRKEDEYLATRNRYTYRKTIRIQEFGPDGKPSGEFVRVVEISPAGEGKVAIKTIEKPQSTLQHVYLAQEDISALERLPLFPLTSSQLAKYELQYLGTEQVDEIDCYIFHAKPKRVERVNGSFDGLVWVDAKYLEVVKTYGKFVTDQGDSHVSPLLPFSMFETYRENVDGKYWFPNYARSDDTLQVKELQIPMRIVIKWSDFKLAPATSAASPAPAAPANAAPASPAKPQ
jgi:hypothetical protein